jgi:WD40 repeat protein
VTGSKDGSRGEISVWHLRTGEQLFSFEGHRWWVNDLHLRGDRVFSCSNDATVTGSSCAVRCVRCVRCVRWLTPFYFVFCFCFILHLAQCGGSRSGAR